MSENLSNQKGDSDLSWARIETGTQGCFSGNNSAIEFYPDDSEKMLVKIFAGDTEKELFIEKSEAKEFMEKIIFLGRKPEVRSESGWTKVVRVKVEWRNLKFVEESSGKISAFSNEWTIEEMEEYLPKIKNAQVAEQVKETLAKGLHRRALEIDLETRKLLKRLLSEQAEI